MKTKWPWLLVPVALVVLATALCRSSTRAGPVSARLVGRSLDPDGQVHLVEQAVQQQAGVTFKRSKKNCVEVKLGQ